MNKLTGCDILIIIHRYSLEVSPIKVLTKPHKIVLLISGLITTHRPLTFNDLPRYRVPVITTTLPPKPMGISDKRPWYIKASQKNNRRKNY
jgi:hypothetical protein